MIEWQTKKLGYLISAQAMTDPPGALDEMVDSFTFEPTEHQEESQVNTNANPDSPFVDPNTLNTDRGSAEAFMMFARKAVKN